VDPIFRAHPRGFSPGSRPLELANFRPGFQIDANAVPDIESAILGEFLIFLAGGTSILRVDFASTCCNRVRGAVSDIPLWRSRRRSPRLASQRKKPDA
jgi:hypothetical protein